MAPQQEFSESSKNKIMVPRQKQNQIIEYMAKTLQLAIPTIANSIHKYQSNYQSDANN